MLRILELARLSENVYSDGPFASASSWRKVKDEQELSGLNWALYTRQGKDGVTEVVLSFAGTEFKN